MPPLELTGPSGRLECILDEPAAPGSIGPDGLLIPVRTTAVRAAVVLGHPHTEYGGTMHTKAVYQSAKALSRIGCAVLRLNFRGAGASDGTFADGIGEQDDFRAALDYMDERYPGIPKWAGGMSFGSWVALTVGAADPRITTLIGIALPVDRYDFAGVAASVKPKFFIHGERDELIPIKLMREFYGRCAEPKELVVVDSADHLFDGKVGEVADAIEDLLGDWHA